MPDFQHNPLAKGGATLAVGVLSMAIGVAWTLWSSEKLHATALKEMQRSPDRLVAVRTLVLGRDEIQSAEERFSGLVLATRRSDLAAKILGRVDKIHVALGDRVESSQALVTLDPSAIQASLSAAEAELTAAETELAKMIRGPRQQEIDRAEAQVQELTAIVNLRRAEVQRLDSARRSGAVSPQAFDDANYGLKAAEAQRQTAHLRLDELREGTRAETIEAGRAKVAAQRARVQQLRVELEETIIRAPFDGVIQRREVDEGEVVAPGKVLLELVEEQLEVHVGLPPRVAAQVAQGRGKVHVEVGHLRFSAQVDRLAPALDEVSGTRQAILKFVDANPANLASGESADVLLRTPLDRSGRWLPTEALTSASHGLWSVFIAKPTEVRGVSQVEMRSVELLRTVGDFSQVQGELSDGAQVICAGVHRVAPGQFVRLATSESH